MEFENQFNPDYMVPPGMILAEALEERGMTEEAFAERAGHPVAYVRNVTTGDAAITPACAEGVETATMIPARFWLNLEPLYQDHVSRYGRTFP